MHMSSSLYSIPWGNAIFTWIDYCRPGTGLKYHPTEDRRYIYCGPSALSVCSLSKRDVMQRVCPTQKDGQTNSLECIVYEAKYCTEDQKYSSPGFRVQKANAPIWMDS